MSFAQLASGMSPTHGRFRCWSRYEAPAGIFWDDEKYKGEAYATFAWAVYVAEVTVDLISYAVSVDDFRRPPGSWQSFAPCCGAG